MRDDIFKAAYSEVLKTPPHLLYEKSADRRITLEEYRKLLSSAVKFSADGELILEGQTPLIDIPEEAVKLLLERCNGRVDGASLKSSFKSSRHWRNLKNVEFGEVYFGLFGFGDSNAIDKFHVSCFGLQLPELDEAREEFRVAVGSLGGFYSSFGGVHVICANLRSEDLLQVMRHELSHLVQTTGGVRIVKEVEPSMLKQRSLLEEEFGASYREVIAYFSGREFIPHVDDIAEDLKKLRKQIGAGGLKFRQMLFKFLKSRSMEDVEEDELFQKLWTLKHGDVSSLMMLLFSKISGYKFQKILSCIEEVFIQ